MGERRGIYRVLVGKPGGKRPLGRPRHRWEDNIKMVLQEVGCGVMDWIEMAEDRDRWRAFETAAIARVTPRPLFGPWKDPVPIVQEAGWAKDRSG
jgi:hypothetical protein